MTPKNFIVLAGITVVAVVGAIAATIIESRVGSDIQLYDEPMFPRLVENANDVARITYRTATETAVIEQKDGVWRYADKYGYPVSTGNVRSVIASIAALRKLEPKTDAPARYASLAVEDVGPAARSREVIIEGPNGVRLAAVVLGRASGTMQFDPLGGMYLRVPGEARSWLVRGTVVLPPSATDWMERQIVHVPGPDIKAIQVKEKGQLVLNTEKEVDPNGVSRYQLVPRDEKTQAADSAVKQVATAIVSLQFDDVRPASMVQWPEGSRELIFATFDGLILSAEVAEIDGRTWARFKASAAPGATGTARVKQIADATTGWVFQMPTFKAPAFNRLLAELTETKAAPTTGPGAGAGGVPGVLGLPGRLTPPGATIPGLGAPIPGLGR
ncbi:MAG: DUF4340 domain-containing protein [Alphaproteobacteria bacterium]|nr:DUF4340 domain-containing protein [Alphaproteobacteria bacterium]